MGLKVVKCSDQAYARIALVAAKQETYLADALDLIIFGKVNHEGNLTKGVTHADSRATKGRTPAGKTKGTKRAKAKASKPGKPHGKLVEGMEDLYED
jgi:hypothetical protein